MQLPVRKIFRVFLKLTIAMVIILGILVGLSRLLLPRLPDYQEEFKAWASAAIGMDVRFTGMSARWRFSGPELYFFEVSLDQLGDKGSFIAADEISISVGFFQLITEREFVVDRVTVRDSSMNLRKDVAGKWMLQGVALDTLLAGIELPDELSGDIVLAASNIDLAYEHSPSGQLMPVRLRTITFSRNEDEFGIEADIDLPENFGGRLEFSANKSLRQSADDVWKFYAEGKSLDLVGWSRLHQFALPNIRSGMADIMLWFDFNNGVIDSASANINISKFVIAESGSSGPYSIQGNFEFSEEPTGWLLGANKLKLITPHSDWPQASIELRLEQNEKGNVQKLRAIASYLNINDVSYIKEWLPTKWESFIDKYEPTGVMRNLSIELDNLQADALDFNVSSDFDNAGFSAVDEKLGIRDFSGRLRADRDGGCVEAVSTGLKLDLGPNFNNILEFDDVVGTVLWRRNEEAVIVLSDSIHIRNSDLDTQISLQASLPAGQSSPRIDFDASWRFLDLRELKHYLSGTFINPKLEQWLENAFLSGYVTRARTRFNGMLSDFPFEGDKGAFRLDARLENATIQYSPRWPAPEFRNLEIVMENTHFWSTENLVVDRGNLYEDARIEIKDLHNPVLTVDAFATGTLRSIHDYISESPIANILGSQLKSVEVNGDASFDLSIRLPLNDISSYDFSTRIRPSDGTVRLAGFPAAITELNGSFTVSRNTVSSDSLFGTFLGHPVDFNLIRAPVSGFPFKAILLGNGHTNTEVVEEALGIVFDGALTGDTNYQATIRFPNWRARQPEPLIITVDTDLVGIKSHLPVPFTKNAEEPLGLSMNMSFPSNGTLRMDGSLASQVNWTANFLKDDNRWDFDRGVIALGEYPRNAAIRGLHIHGQIEAFAAHKWFLEPWPLEERMAVSERIRTIDVEIDNFYAWGQHFTNHRIQADRSGRDWLLRLSGQQLQGRVTIPYDFDAGRLMTFDMERLHLPGDKTKTTESGTQLLNPEFLPSLSVRADNFSLGEHQFGRLEADIERSGRGLVTSLLTTEDKTFSLSGQAGWLVDAANEFGQRTFVDAIITSTDTQQTAQRLAYNPGIISDQMEIIMDVDWSGGPRSDFMGALNGEVTVQLGAGRLSEVDPGAGRMFGLMSITALPRRLALDFSDVFSEGFGYDQIKGDFRLVDGDAYTCNLTFTGPAADVGIVGRTGLVARDYDQAAIVSANVGGSLPVAGFLFGGPQVAAALLIFSQVFQKPLKDMGEIFYAVTGPWESPGIDLSDSQRFAEVSTRAGCLSQEQIAFRNSE